MSIYTAYEMMADCRAGRPDGWLWFSRTFVPPLRVLVAHYRPEHSAQSLQTLLGMLSLAERHSQTAEAREALRDVRARVESMAVLQRLLYQKDTLGSVGAFPFLEELAQHMLELFPQLAGTKILRQWTGLCDMTPDFSPVMGVTEVDGFVVDCGWGTYGFKAAPIVGVTLAELIATGRTPDLIEPFRLERFATDTLVSELAAAAVSH